MNAYLHGPSPTPLLGETIGDNLRRTVERLGERDALVVRSQSYRATYRQLWDSTTVRPVRCSHPACRRATASASGRRIATSGSSSQYATARIGAILVNINPAYKTAELEYVLEQSGTSLLIHARAFRPERLRADRSRKCGPTAPQLREAVASTPDWMSLLERAHRIVGPRDRGARVDPAIRRPHQHPVHLRHDGLPERGDAVASQHPEQRVSRGRDAQLHGARSRLHPGAVLPLLRHGDGQPRLHYSWRLHGRSGRGVRPARDPGNDRRRALHVAVRRADDVHRRARAPALRRVRSDVAAHRHHGGRALSRRSDEAGPVAHAHAGSHHRLRHDRDLAHVDADAAGTTRSIAACRRSAASIPTSRSRSSTRIGRHRPARRARRALHARLQRDDRLLGQRRGHAGRDRRGRLDAHRRPCHDGRRRVRQHRRPHQGHDHPRRRKHLSARGRRVPLHPHVGAGRAGDWRTSERRTARK